MNWFFNLLGSKKKKYKFSEQRMCGVIPSSLDERDYVCSTTDLELPSEFMMLGYDVKFQGTLGYCASFATCSTYEIMNKISNNRVLNLSEMFLGYNTCPTPTSGAVLRDVLQYVKDEGIALEVFCPYDTSKWDEEPSWSAYFSARYYRIKNYFRVLSQEEMKKSIYEGSPIIIGIKVYQDYLNTKGRVIQEPKGSFVGGHAMTLIGWCQTGFYVLNSWGDGVLILPYKIAEKQIFESWRINP